MGYIIHFIAHLEDDVMNMTIVLIFFFFSFVLCIGICAYLMVSNVGGWGWLLLIIILFFGSIKISSHDTNAECPNCGEKFIIKKDNK